jgi:hypothetical protein
MDDKDKREYRKLLEGVRPRLMFPDLDRPRRAVGLGMDKLFGTWPAADGDLRDPRPRGRVHPSLPDRHPRMTEERQWYDRDPRDVLPQDQANALAAAAFAVFAISGGFQGFLGLT